jgi:hypothetical protein
MLTPAAIDRKPVGRTAAFSDARDAPPASSPAYYTALGSQFSLDPDRLDWKEVPSDRGVESDLGEPLTIDEAKRGLARSLGLSPHCIEISIRT